MESPLFTFGIVTDVQYADKQDDFKSGKLYRMALNKLEECIKTFNGDSGLEFVAHLGDIIDGNKTEEKSQEDFEQVLKAFNKLTHKTYHVIGNHCLRVPREEIRKKLGFHSEKEGYYSFTVKNEWKFIVLDGTDISTSGWSTESSNYQEAVKWLDSHPISKYPHASNWNAAIGEKQKAWLIEHLKDAKKANQKVFVLNHYPLLEEAAANTHLLWNAEEIVQIFESQEFKGVVVGYFCGHYHAGGFTKRNNIHYWTVKGILEAPLESNCFAKVSVFRDRFEIKGFGTESNKTCRW